MNREIVRIVRMTFREEKIDDFLELFEDVKKDIRSFKGCKYLELLKDTASSNIFTSYSIWESNDSLENYRTSDLFRNTWNKTKLLFIAQPVAHSYVIISKA
jgi:heme-degrading monooxygenase HmoA